MVFPYEIRINMKYRVVSLPKISQVGIGRVSPVKLNFAVLASHKLSLHCGGSLPMANASETPSTSRIRAAPARVHFAGGCFVLSWAVKT